MNIIKSTLLCISFIAAEQITAMESQRSIADSDKSVEKVNLDQSYLTKSYTYTLEEAQEELKKNPYALHDACRSNKGGNYQKVEMLIKAGANVNAIDKNDMTPIHYTASHNNSSTLALLIKKGASVNASDNLSNITPLFIASDHGIPKNIEILVNAGANINKKDNLLFYTPLMNATSSIYGQKNAIKLIELGADINEKDKTNKTALHLATNRKHSKLTLLLLEKGADPLQQDINGWTALHFAAQYTYTEKYPSICAIILGSLRFFDKNKDYKPSKNHELSNKKNYNKLIKAHYKQELFTLIKKSLSIYNDNCETAIGIAMANNDRDQKAIALLTQVENTQSYSELPEEIKVIAKKNIEKHIQLN